MREGCVMKTIYVVFQDNDRPIICGIYTTKKAAKECIAAAEKVGLCRCMEDYKLQTKYDFAIRALGNADV